jgi:hypothetical protein
MRSVVTVLILLLALAAQAAQVRLHGTVTGFDDRRPLADVFVRVYRNGIVVATDHTGPGGHYSFVLENGAEHIIRFSLPGHVTKCYAVDTHGPAWEDDSRVVDVEVEMTLFPKVPELDLSFFDLPMGVARFTPMTGFLSWNDTYERAVRDEVNRLMAEVALVRRNASALAVRGGGASAAVPY